jgi:hypothetical protein
VVAKITYILAQGGRPDRNTKFFHQRAGGHAKKNRIKMNKTPGGRVTKDTKEMESLATDFIKQLNMVDPTIRPLQIVSRYEPLVSLEMNNELCKEFTDE